MFVHNATHRLVSILAFAAACTPEGGVVVSETDSSSSGGVESLSSVTGDASTGTTDGTTGVDPVSPDVPTDVEFCADAIAWDPVLTMAEVELVARINELRMTGGDCGAQSFEPGQPLAMHGNLRCAARIHSLDMATNDFFDHSSLDGTTFQERALAAGYDGMVDESLAAGTADPTTTFQQLRDSESICLQFMNPAMVYIGVGVADGGSFDSVWTLVYGTP